MKKIGILFVGVLVAVLAVSGCIGQSSQIKNDSMKAVESMVKNNTSNNSMMEKEAGIKNNSMMKENQTMTEENIANESMMKSVSYSGTVLAGTTAKLIDFNKADYDLALKSQNIVVLYFYANWCPLCKAEVPEMYKAFDKLTTYKVVGFRINYNDGDTDDNERKLAEQYQVPYQHTKVILKNGQVVIKSPESWNKDRYIMEINNLLK